MTLQNLLGVTLDTIEPDPLMIGKLLAAARRNIADAQLPQLSAENRFDAAYKAILQCAMAALQSNGYRTLTSKPGHHQTALQSLTVSVGVPSGDVIVLDALRKQRNLADYSGDLVPEATAAECLLSAQSLYAHVSGWLRVHRAHWSLAD